MAPDGQQNLDLPTGYYFDPKDDIAIHYLKQKILGRELPADIIPTIHDLYACHPRSIPYDEFRYGTSDCWWFFTSRPNNVDFIREGVGENNGDLTVEGIGYWRTTNIFQIDHEGKNIGCKITRLFFYDNPENNVRINNLVIRQHITYEFIVKESAFEPQDLTNNVKQQMEHFVLCKVSNIETVEGLVNNLMPNCG